MNNLLDHDYLWYGLDEYIDPDDFHLLLMSELTSIQNLPAVSIIYEGEEE